MSGKVPPLVFNIIHYKLRITTVSMYLCVQILSAHTSWSISGCSSGIVIVFPSQILDLHPRSIHISNSTQGHWSEQLYSSSDAVGAPQLDI